MEIPNSFCRSFCLSDCHMGKWCTCTCILSCLCLIHVLSDLHLKWLHEHQFCTVSCPVCILFYVSTVLFQVATHGTLLYFVLHFSDSMSLLRSIPGSHMRSSAVFCPFLYVFESISLLNSVRRPHNKHRCFLSCPGCIWFYASFALCPVAPQGPVLYFVLHLSDSMSLLISISGSCMRSSAVFCPVLDVFDSYLNFSLPQVAPWGAVVYFILSWINLILFYCSLLGSHTRSSAVFCCGRPCQHWCHVPVLLELVPGDVHSKHQPHIRESTPDQHQYNLPEWNPAATKPGKPGHLHPNTPCVWHRPGISYEEHGRAPYLQHLPCGVCGSVWAPPAHILSHAVH